MSRTLITAAGAVLALLVAAAAAQAGPLDPPWDFAGGGQAGAASGGRGLLLGLVSVWQGAVAPVDGITCPSEPSCSRYAAEAVRRHGALLGSFMAADRLIHELSEAEHAPLVRTPRGYKIDDPVSANDFWLTWH